MDEQAIVKLVPGTLDSDADGVKMSLEAARALASSGEPEEALRLVRRAAEAAEQAGDDMRSITLARAAADIANEIERVKKGGDASDDVPASKRNLPSPPSRKSVPTPPPTPVSTTGAAAPNAPSPPSTRASHAPQAPSGKSSPQAAPPPQEPAAEAHAVSEASPSAEAHEHAEPAQRPAPKKVEARPAAAPHVPHAAAPPPPGISELVSQGRAVRVLVKRSARDESLYIVRPHATAHVPIGAREAFLVLGDADPDFLSGATR